MNPAWDLIVTIPIVFFFFKETKQVSLEDIDLLFGERALGTLPDDIANKGLVPAPQHISDVENPGKSGKKPTVAKEARPSESLNTEAVPRVHGEELPGVREETEPKV
jgi:hypothetical protein